MFVVGSIAKQMLDCVVEAPGHSGLVARCLLMKKFPALLQADHEWTKRYFVGSLLADDRDSILLWRAVAEARIDTHALRIIGSDLLTKVRDRRLGEDTRESLIRRVVFEAMEAFRDHRAPAVTPARLSQLLRSGDDEVRIFTARAIREFQEEAPEKTERVRSSGEVFETAVKPFVQRIWPQERSFATSGVSGEFASLPARAGEAFGEAVEELERFLAPFDCWTLFEYGFHVDDDEPSDETPQLSVVIDSERKARALLSLLDLTVGETQTSVIPDDLSLALDRIEKVAPKLATDPAFRRLAAAARR